MAHLFLLVLAALRLAAAETTISVIAPFESHNQKGMAASVVGADSAKTTYAIVCKAENCNIKDETMTLTQGPGTYAQTIVTTVTDWDGKFPDELESGSDPVYRTATLSNGISCKLNPKLDRASCNGVFAVTVGSKSNSQEVREVLTEYKESMVAVTITAGVGKLSPAPGATHSDEMPTVTTSADVAGPTVSLSKIKGSESVYSLTPLAGVSSASAPATPIPTSTFGAGAKRSCPAGLAGAVAVIGGMLLL